MALPFYMTIKGKAQGNIEGCNSATGHEKEIQCHALAQSIKIPFNPIDGKPAGMRTHGPLKIAKSFDKSSPLLYQALVSGERLDVELKFYRISPETGGEEHYFTIKMTEAAIVEIQPAMLNHFDPTLARYDHLEEVSFTYKQIDWRWEIDGIASADKWQVV